MDQSADDVHISIAMSDHHTLGARGRAAGIVDGQQIILSNRWAGEGFWSIRQYSLVVKPARLA